MKDRKTPKVILPAKEPWRRFYMSEDEVTITPAPKPKNSGTSEKNRQLDK